MANVMNLLGAVVKSPSGFWSIILNWIEKGVVSYGWVIILFTLLVKVCMSPLDFLMKFTTKKQTLVQQKLAPQVARINKKYANDKNAAQAQINSLYKKEGLNVFVSCFVMIAYLALTMTVFFTLFKSLRVMSAYKAINQYNAIQTSYVDTYKQSGEENFYIVLKGHDSYYLKNSDEPLNDPYNTFKTNFEGDGTEENIGLVKIYFSFEDELNEEQTTFLDSHYVKKAENEEYVSFLDLLKDAKSVAESDASKSANETWKEVKDSWLWISNIWVADNQKSPLPSYKDLSSIAKNSDNKEYKAYVKSIDENLYNQITNAVHKQNSRWNGYYILAILAGLTSFLSQWITELMSKTKNKDVNRYVENSNPTGGTMKFMKILLPAMMVIFVLTSSSAFGIYIVISSVISIAISALTNWIVNLCYKKKQEEIMAYLEKETLKAMKKNG